MKKSRAGRKSLLTPETTAAICQGLELCLTLEDAAQNAGVEKSTVFRWLQQGREQASGQYREFFNAIEAAKAKRRFRINGQMVAHSKKHWQALAWLAERTDPSHYGLRLKVQVNDELERIFAKLERTLPPQEYERAIQAIAEPDDSGPEVGEDSRRTGALGRGLAAGMGAAIDASLSEPDASS